MFEATKQQQGNIYTAVLHVYIVHTDTVNNREVVQVLSPIG